MQMSFFGLCFLALVLQNVAAEEVSHGHKHHKGHHHHHHHHHHKGHHHAQHHHHNVKASKPSSPATRSVPAVVAVPKAAPPTAHVEVSKVAKQANDAKLVAKMKELEQRLAKKQVIKEGQILVNGPLPADFKARFAQAVAHATGADATKVVVTKTEAASGQPGIITVDFKAPGPIVAEVREQSGDADSKLAKGNLHSFLVDDSDNGAGEQQEPKEQPTQTPKAREMPTPVEEKGLDIDTAMPYGELEPFGREDTAQELTENSITESNEMVDQLERAEVAEEKRAVFRALTRLRGAAITSFDGVARSQTGNIDEYNKIHQWRKTHPLHHLADEESDISKWAFPDNADF